MPQSTSCERKHTNTSMERTKRQHEPHDSIGSEQWTHVAKIPRELGFVLDDVRKAEVHAELHVEIREAL